jgi:hypothetical protein
MMVGNRGKIDINNFFGRACLHHEELADRLSLAAAVSALNCFRMPKEIQPRQATDRNVSC